MTRLINRPTQVLVVPGTDTLEVHSTVLAALATQAPQVAEFLTAGIASVIALREAVDTLLNQDDEPETPVAWRLVQTEHGHLGEPYFAIDGCAEVASCGPAQAWVTDNGFTMNTAPSTLFRAIETVDPRPLLIHEDGTEAGELTDDEAHLARFLAAGHKYVTAVRCGYRGAVEQTLYALRARLTQTQGDTVTLV